jgi:MFS family permease
LVRRLSGPFAALADVFRNPDLGRLQLAWAGISFATWAFAIALGVYAFDAAGAAAVGIASLVRVLPGALASPFGGLLGDRYSRRAVLIGSTLGGTIVLALATVAVAADAPTWLVFLLGGLFTACAAPYTPAEAALLPQLARTPQELSAANVAQSIMDNAGFLAGALLTGLLLGVASVQAAFGVAAAVCALSLIVLLPLSRDRRPEYEDDGDAEGVVRQTVAGFAALVADPPLRLLAACHGWLSFVEGAADVLVVLIALDLLGLGNSSVGVLSAMWGIGALVGSAGLAVLLNRGHLVSGLVIGSLVIGVACGLPGLWPVTTAAVLSGLGVGFGYTFVDVAARTLFQRLGDDEVLARSQGALEAGRLLGMSLGAVAMTPLVELFGIRVTVLLVAAVMPAFVILRWSRLRSYEVGAPVAEQHFALLRSEPIFAPLSLATLERLTQDLIAIEVEPGQEVITQGDRGDRFYMIESGEVEVFEDGRRRRAQHAGESFGEIALLRDEPRTATVRTTEPTRLLALDRESFIAAVTGHRRSTQAAESVIEGRLAPAGGGNIQPPG